MVAHLGEGPALLTLHGGCTVQHRALEERSMFIWFWVKLWFLRVQECFFFLHCCQFFHTSPPSITNSLCWWIPTVWEAVLYWLFHFQAGDSQELNEFPGNFACAAQVSWGRSVHATEAETRDLGFLRLAFPDLSAPETSCCWEYQNRIGLAGF